MLTDDYTEIPGPLDTETCPDPVDPHEPTHTWCGRSYEPREHCSTCGVLRYPDPNRPSRHKP